MPSPPEPRAMSENRLLAALPADEYERLRPGLEPVHLPQGKTIYEAGDGMRHAYFLRGGTASMLSITEDGETIEVAMVGSEGVIGVPIILGVSVTPYRVVAQAPVAASRVAADVLRREFNRGGRLQELLLKYTHALITQISQSAVCNRFHTVEQRLSRWLLVASDRVRSDDFQLTQEFISHMLGVPRTTVTVIAGAFQKAGLIRHSRGRVQLLDRPGLEATACACYRVVRDQVSPFFAA